MNDVPTPARAAAGWRRHTASILVLAIPLAASQLAQIAMGVTDTILVGALGGPALAAGGLGAAIFFSLGMVLQGVLASLSAMVAQTRGAGAPDRVPGLYWTGLALALALAVPAVLALGSGTALLSALGETPALASTAGAYLRVLRWGMPAALLLGLLRAFLPAIGAARLLVHVMPPAALANGVLTWALIHGGGGLPRLGLAGSATGTVVTLWGTVLALLGALHVRPKLRAWAAPAWPRIAALREMLWTGLPIGATLALETGLFIATGLMMGLLGPAALAAHQVALSVASVCFMVPLGIGQAANVRVGFWAGAGRPDEARRAGLAAIGLGGVFMATTAAVLLALPRPIVGLYLPATAPGAAATAVIAVRLLGLAALFQVADGVQVVAVGALRGLQDTRIPMVLAALGYWGIGFPLGYGLAFHAGAGPAGLWWGLAAGLGAVAAMLTWRFLVLSRVSHPAMSS